MHDLVSYNEKHNEANGDYNSDGESNNRSWNCGTEGPSDDPSVVNLRNRQKRNFLTSMMLSQGAPMLLSGDEMGRTQQGNNNGYCQDNEISWQNWEKVDEDLLAFTQKLINYRKKHPAFHRRRWFEGLPLHGSELRDIEWFTTEGKQMASEDWGNGFVKSVAIFLNGKTIPNPNPRGEPVVDDNFYVVFNAYWEPLEYTLPGNEWGEKWVKELDTAVGWIEEEQIFKADAVVKVEGRSIVVLCNAT